MINVNLFFMFFIIVLGTSSAQDIASGKNFMLEKSAKISISYSGIHDQISLNPSFVIKKGKREFDIGLFYRHLNANTLIVFKDFKLEANYYGLKCGYLNNIRESSSISVQGEANVLMLFVNSNVMYNQKLERSTPVVFTAITWGPNISIRLDKYLYFVSTFQLGLSYGIGTSINRNHFSPKGMGWDFEIYPYLGMQFKL